MSRLLIYDCTLRDGMQGEGMSLSVEEKLRVAHLLDDLGVPMIEAGFPASNPKEAELFARLETAGLRPQVAAFGMTRRRDTTAADDPALRGLAASFGLEAGKPASIIGTPRSSRRCATRSFSSTDSDIPSPCMPSRRVQS